MEKKTLHATTMPSESTPLLQSVPVTEQPERYPHRTLRRVCTITLTAVPVVVLITFLVLTLLGVSTPLSTSPQRSSSELFAEQSVATAPHAAWPESKGISYSKLKHILTSTPKSQKAHEWSQYYTAGPHLAGKNLSQAEWTRDRWLDFGVDYAEVVAYDVYINYPLDHGLSLLEDGKVKFKATLEEDVLKEDPTSGLEDRIPTFHGYSASGNVTAPFVFVNYGTFADYEALQNAGVDLEGKIALAKYGGIFRGLKVKRASELGMIGVVIYSDPGDDGSVTEEKGLKPYPEGPARNPSSVQRGSCQYLSVAPGDPTTIGYASKPGVPRQSVEGKIPDIPSLPISYAEALPLLKALNGHGPNASSFPSHWHTGGLGYKGVHYNIGPSPDSVQISLYNEQEYVTNPLWNAIGVINGTISDEVIVVGNHRDAWIAGGAGDPNSGSAALNEVVRSFGKAVAAGWQPQRTIVFASWDGEEYGLIGSTEWVEDYLPWLSGSTVAYINVDVGAEGPNFKTSAAPLLNKAIYEVTEQVLSPNQTTPGQTIRDTWSGKISTMGSGSDFTAFQDFAGIPSIDLGFGSGLDDPVYHYHSNYDSLAWMDRFGDPGFEYHIAIAKIILLLAAKLSEEPIIQFNATDYAVGLAKYLNTVEAAAEVAMGVHVDTSSLLHLGGSLKDGGAPTRTTSWFKKISAAVSQFHSVAVAFDAHAASLDAQLSSSSFDVLIDRRALYSAARAVNQKYQNIEREFLHAPGLDSRTWFKHVVFAPGLWTGYAGATFPGLVEALTLEDDDAVEKWAGIIAERIQSAAHSLE